MPDLSPDILAEVASACTAGVEEAVASLQRNLGAEVGLSVGQPGKIDTQALPEGFSGPGLVVVLTCGSTAALVLFPETSGIVPAWCAEPDATGQSKLSTLAQELGMVLLPESYMPDDFKAGMVKSLTGALARGGVTAGAAVVPLAMKTAKGGESMAYLIWPASKPAAVLGAGAGSPKPAASKPPAPKPAAAPATPRAAPPSAVTPAAKPQSPARAHPTRLDDLPQYARSLLRIQVPVVVTLAEKRQPLGWIVELGPGSIIQFDKSCEEMLDLDVGGHRVATGEAVKVGDKFGLRITSVVLPDERFQAVKGKQAAGSKQ